MVISGHSELVSESLVRKMLKQVQHDIIKVATTFKSWAKIPPKFWVLTQDEFLSGAKAKNIYNTISHDLKVVAIQKIKS